MLLLREKPHWPEPTAFSFCKSKFLLTRPYAVSSYEGRDREEPDSDLRLVDIRHSCNWTRCRVSGEQDALHEPGHWVATGNAWRGRPRCFYDSFGLLVRAIINKNTMRRKSSRSTNTYEGPSVDKPIGNKKKYVATVQYCIITTNAYRTKHIML